MRSQRELAAERRREKLAVVQDQIDQGMLIRKMTPKERAANPPRPRSKKGVR
jgi:hypothetical protein